MITLILGGARSGKSSFAIRLAELAGSKAPQANLHYVATATAFDDEMLQRIEHHRSKRGDEWCTHEAPYELAETLRHFTSDDVVIVDCLILWLNNILFQLEDSYDDSKVESYLTQLNQTLIETKARVILVSNEVGMGVVPSGELSHLFSHFAGSMNQIIAQTASNVVLISAGMSVNLKGHIDMGKR